MEHGSKNTEDNHGRLKRTRGAKTQEEEQTNMKIIKRARDAICYTINGKQGDKIRGSYNEKTNDGK